MKKEDFEITYYRSSGPGGQRKNKKDTAVRIKHKLTGIVVTATEYRQQARNRKLAIERLEQKLANRNKKNKLRIPTKIPRAIKEEILKKKRKRSEKKKERSKIKQIIFDE